VKDKSVILNDMIIEGLESDQEIGSTKSTENITENTARIEKETGIGTIETETEIERDTDKAIGTEKEKEIETEIAIIKTIKSETRVPCLRCPTQATCQTIVLNFVVRLGLHDTSFDERLRAPWVALSLWNKC
jgi:hypothetical protein